MSWALFWFIVAMVALGVACYLYFSGRRPPRGTLVLAAPPSRAAVILLPPDGPPAAYEPRPETMRAVHDLLLDDRRAQIDADLEPTPATPS